MTPTLPDPQTDPTGYVLAVADYREPTEDELRLFPTLSRQALADIALWRGITERHRIVEGESPPACSWCWTEGEQYHVIYPCPDLLGAVAAAKAYADGTP